MVVGYGWVMLGYCLPIDRSMDLTHPTHTRPTRYRSPRPAAAAQEHRDAGARAREAGMDYNDWIQTYTPRPKHAWATYPPALKPHDTPTKQTNGTHEQRITKAINRNVEMVSSARALKAGDTFSVKDIKVRACMHVDTDACGGVWATRPPCRGSDEHTWSPLGRVSLSHIWSLIHQSPIAPPHDRRSGSS